MPHISYRTLQISKLEDLNVRRSYLNKYFVVDILNPFFGGLKCDYIIHIYN